MCGQEPLSVITKEDYYRRKAAKDAEREKQLAAKFKDYWCQCDFSDVVEGTILPRRYFV
jgi:hypothetical protein